MVAPKSGIPDTDWCRPTVAVDIDLTLSDEPWRSHSFIGRPAPYSWRVLRRFVDAGWQVIVYSCRPDCHLLKRWAALHYPGLISGFNFNPEESAKSRVLIPKPFASLYIDDKNWPLQGGPVDWLEVERDMEQRGIFKKKRG